MSPGEVVLSIDYGAADTVAVLTGPDGNWIPLRFDGADALPSAVFLNGDGGWVTGQQAWQAAPGAPERFELTPVRQLRQEHLSLGGIEVDVRDMLAATLRRVAAQATARLGGVPPGEVRLVVPAGWGPRRRTAMREAAYRAGLGQPALVDAPVAAAEHLVATGVRLLVGSFIAVCDLGGGCETSVLRRTPHGFQVLSTVDDPDAGGLALDQLVAEYLPALSPPAGDPASTAADAGERVTLLATARGTREAAAGSAAVCQRSRNSVLAHEKWTGSRR